MASVEKLPPGRFQRFVGKHALLEPAQVFNKWLLIGCLIFGTIGAARGFDEGNVSNMLNNKDFKRSFGLVASETNSKAHVAAVSGDIASMVQLASIGGAAFAFVASDRIGRVWTLRMLCVFWCLGVCLQITAHSLGQLYTGRVIAGLGIGATTVVGPTYLIEVAPASVRGLCTAAFSGSVYIGIALSYATTYGASRNIPVSRLQWQVPFMLQIIAAGLALVSSVFAIESPRYLFMRGQEEKALVALEKIRRLPRDDPYCVAEARRIKDGIAAYEAAIEGKSLPRRMVQIVATTANRYRLIGIGIASQTLSQWSGASSITLFAPEFFGLLGVTGQETKLFATLLFGIVKLLASLACALFIVDRLGRKRSLYIGMSLQTLSILYMAILTVAVPGLQHGEIHGNGVKAASTVGIIAIYLNGMGWALGWNSLQYVIAAEIWPIELRSIGTSIIMGAHFILQWSNSKAVPSLLQDTSSGGITAAGTFFLMSAVCMLGLIYAYFFLPELAGHTLESMEAVFSGPWWKIGRAFANVEPPAVVDRGYASSTHRASMGSLEELDMWKLKEEQVEQVEVDADKQQTKRS